MEYGFFKKKQRYTDNFLKYMQLLYNLELSFLFSKKSVLLKEILFHGDREGI